ncbi:heterokaryon incompatibility protein-domain-containing protein [Paraphoma chrysanthemicola]|uniref:Heterokaryon incompatibility protein-domain-containing protein n=1 Tax=Paraphoma chrysanthemicola TaxID=798071 RepID=A0A8K0R0V5_9PLEO|nr:heterokaryon incompatibility protein-domain-containing protein [Paraphoma chrysanthemicola]
MTSSKTIDVQLDTAASTPPLEGVEMPKPKYDNFYTPQNQDFYNQFKYINLDRKARHIRLLRIHPIEADEDDSAIVRCDIVDNLPLVSMERKFTTLSYCAGDPKKTESILVNDIHFNAFANLGHALRQVRHYWNKNRNGKELLLWADQVCIDQSNSNERSHQVNFMGDIYAAAEQVLICLSVEGSPTGGFKWFKSSTKTIEELQHTQFVKHKWKSTEELRNEQFIILNWFNDYLHRGWDAFIRTFIISTWFKRAWVRQEFFRSQQAVFLAAFEAAPCDDALSRFPYTLDRVIYQLRPPDNYSLNLPESCPASITNCTLCRLTNDSSYLRRDWHIVTYFMSLRKVHLNDLVTNLSAACLCQSSDERDLIYSFLGYSVECYGIYPDYDPTVSYASLCAQLARNYLRHNGNFDLLANAYKRRSKDPSMPSWVPDWRIESLKNFPFEPQNRKTHRISKAEVTFQRYGEDFAQNVLTARGLLLLRLGRCTRPMRQASCVHIDIGSEYWTIMGFIRAWGPSSEGDEVWILPGASQAFIFSRKGQYHELRGEMVFLQPSELRTENVEYVIEFTVLETLSYEYHDSQMAILVEKVNRLVEGNDPSIQTINIC